MADTVETVKYQVETGDSAQKLEGVAAAVDKLAISVTREDRAKKTSLDGLLRWIQSLDKQTAVFNRQFDQFEKLKRYRYDEIGAAEQLARVEGLLTEKFDQQHAKVDAVAKRHAELTAKYDKETTSAKAMAKEIAEVNEAFNAGIKISGGYEAKLESIALKYNEVTEASQRAARAAREGITRAGSVSATTYKASDSEFASNAQGAFNERLGVTAGDRRGVPTAGDSALKDAAENQDRLTAATEKYLNLIDPAREARLKYNAAIREANELEKVGELSPLERAIAEDKLTAAYEKQVRVLNGTAEAERQAAEAKKAAKADAQAAEDAQNRLAASAQKYRESIDPLVGLHRRYKESVAEVAELEKAGNLTRAEASKINTRLKTEYDDTSRKTRALAEAHENLNKGMLGATQSSRAMQFAVTNLSFQLNDVFTSLASGQSITRTAAQQFGQFVQVFQQGGGVKNVISEFGATILRLLTPLNLFLVGVAALGAGFLLLVSRASATEGRLRSFDVILRSMGTRGQTTSAGLDQVVKDLRDTGTAADDAFKAVQQFSRVPGINPATAKSLVPLARDISAAKGGDFGQIGADMADAFSKGTDEAIKFAQAIGGPNALTALEIKNMQTMALHGDRAGALRIEIAALQRQFGGSFKDSMSDAEKAVTSISGAWSKFLDKLSDTKAVKSIQDALISMLNTVSDRLNRENPQGPIQNANVPRSYLIGVKPLTPAQEQFVLEESRGQSNVSGGALTSGARSTLTGTGGLQSTFADPLQRMIEDAAAKGITLGIGSGFRSTERQSQLYESDLAKHGGTPSGMVAAPGHSMHELGGAADLVDASGHTIRRGTAADTYLQENLDRFGLTRPMSYEPWHVERMGGRRVARAFDLSTDQTFGTGVLASAKAPAAPVEVPVGFNEKQKADLNDQLQLDKKIVDATRQVGESKIYWTAYWQALGSGTKDEIQVAQATEAAQQAVAVWRTELQKGEETQKIRNDLALNEAKAFGTDVVAGYRAAATAAATLEVRAGSALDVARKRQELLTTAAVDAIRVGREQAALAVPQLARQQQLLDATVKGTAAQQDQEIANAATEKTLDAVNRAKAAGIKVLEDEAKKIYDTVLAQEKYNASLKAGQTAAEEINRTRLQVQSTRLETRLTASGLPQDEITRQLDFQQITDTLNTTLLKAPPALRNTYRDINTELANSKYQLTQVQREQQRWNDLVSALASKIDNELTTSIENAFSGEKIDDWGTRIKKWIGSAASSISSSLFIKPALGTLAGALGFGTVAQSLGSFSGLTGSGTGSTGSNLSITKNEDGTFSLSTVSSGASLLSSGSSLFGGGGGIFSSINSFGSSLGFASPVSGLSSSDISSLGSLIGIDDKSLGFLSSPSTISGSLFGGTTLTGALGSVGAGLGAGLTLNSLLGGTKIGGSVGSVGGSLTGSLVGSLFGPVGTLLGGVLGGSGGGLLGGLVGQKHTSNLASGLSIDLGTGVSSGFASGGSKENDKSVREISKSLTNFTKDIQSTTKGTVSGYINPQVGEHGTKLDYNIPGYGSGTYDAADTQDAIDKAELAIAHGLTGITDNMKKVIDQITDPADLDAAVKFAKAYDKVAEAAKDAFASIPSDLDIDGPFKKAKDDLKDTFDSLADDAKKYGLSLTPITAARTEANKRLTKDFDRTMDDLITAAEDPLQSLVDIEKRAGAARLKDAKEVNGDIEKVNKYNKEALDKIWKDSTKSIVDFQKELKSGDLSGKTATQKIKAAQDDYNLLLADVKSGKSAKFDDFVTSGKDLYNLYTEAYGAGPKTSGLRTDILAAIDDVLATRSFAKGGSTRPGWNRVGEQGPEWMYTPSPTWVLPAGQAPASSGTDMHEVTSVMRDILREMRANTAISRIGHTETIDRLDAQLNEMVRPATFEPARRKVTATA